MGEWEAAKSREKRCNWKGALHGSHSAARNHPEAVQGRGFMPRMARRVGCHHGRFSPLALPCILQAELVAGHADYRSLCSLSGLVLNLYALDVILP